MANPYKTAAKNSQSSKSRRLCGGGYASGGAVSNSPGTQAMKKGGATKKDKKVEGAKAKPRSDRKKRGHFDDGGAINSAKEEKAMENNAAMALNPGNKLVNQALSGLSRGNSSSTGTSLSQDEMDKVKSSLSGNGDSSQRKNGGKVKAKRKWDGGGIDGEERTGPSGMSPMVNRSNLMQPQVDMAPRMPPGMKRGGKAAGKYARGGRTKDKSGTKINITVGMPEGGGPQMIPVPKPIPIPMPPPGGGLPPGLPPMGPGGPPMPPPGIGPGGPSILPRARGGRTNLKAGSGSALGRMEKMGKNLPLKRK